MTLVRSTNKWLKALSDEMYLPNTQMFLYKRQKYCVIYCLKALKLLQYFLNSCLNDGGKGMKRMEKQYEVNIKLDNILKKRRMTKRELARKADIRHTLVWEMCHNKTKRLPLDKLAKICSVIRC